jgi:hypothetical protein
MANQDDFPKLGRDIQSWSELDSWLPILDLDIELFRRRNVRLASLVILSALLKSEKHQREKLFEILTSVYFDPKSLPRYFYEKIVVYLQEHDTIPVAVLENWIPEYSFEVWGESPPEERMLFGNNLTLRQILNFDPTNEQISRAIELRKMVMEKKGYS